MIAPILVSIALQQFDFSKAINTEKIMILNVIFQYVTGSNTADINRFRSHTGKRIRSTKLIRNKDDNIHKSEGLKWKDKRTLTLV